MKIIVYAAVGAAEPPAGCEFVAVWCEEGAFRPYGPLCYGPTEEEARARAERVPEIIGGETARRWRKGRVNG